MYPLTHTTPRGYFFSHSFLPAKLLQLHCTADQFHQRLFNWLCLLFSGEREGDKLSQVHRMARQMISSLSPTQSSSSSAVVVVAVPARYREWKDVLNALVNCRRRERELKRKMAEKNGQRGRARERERGNSLIVLQVAFTMRMVTWIQCLCEMRNLSWVMRAHEWPSGEAMMAKCNETGEAASQAAGTFCVYSVTSLRCILTQLKKRGREILLRWTEWQVPCKMIITLEVTGISHKNNNTTCSASWLLVWHSGSRCCLFVWWSRRLLWVECNCQMY